tara:strand:+ start:4032 stop:4775 length:744 start_codon:yes stop_codon:yes gene_type:complete
MTNTDQDIFNNKDKDGNPVETSNNPFDDKLKGIVDDTGKPKYESVDKALEALAHSQAHIKTLEGEGSTREEEIKKLREELEKRSTVEDFVNKLAPPTPDTVPKPTNEGGNGLDEAKVAELIANTLNQKDKATMQKNNITSVVNSLKEKFGGAAATEVSNKAKELGMTTEELQAMAADKPTLVLSLFGEKVSKPQPTTPSHTTSPRATPESDDNEKRNLLRGGITSQELTAGWKAIGKDVHEKYGVTK